MRIRTSTLMIGLRGSPRYEAILSCEFFRKMRNQKSFRWRNGKKKTYVPACGRLRHGREGRREIHQEIEGFAKELDRFAVFLSFPPSLYPFPSFIPPFSLGFLFSECPMEPPVVCRFFHTNLSKASSIAAANSYLKRKTVRVRRFLVGNVYTPMCNEIRKYTLFLYTRVDVLRHIFVCLGNKSRFSSRRM